MNSGCYVQFLLLAALLMAITGCGSSNLAGTSANSGSGAITAKLSYATSKTAKAVAALPAGVATVEVTVTGTAADGNAIPVVKGVFDNTTSSETLNGIYPGTVTLGVLAKDINGNVLYEGYAINTTVTSGATTSVAITMTPPIVKAENTACTSCHETTLDATGQNLVADYKQSGHYTNTSWTANGKNGSTLPGCAGCHGTQHNDLAPSTSGRCFECHGTNLSLRHVGSGTDARYLSAGDNNCSACHEPHNPINGVGYQERKEWAQSGHAALSGLPFIDYDFKNKNNFGDVSCQRCHTTTGFVNFLTSGYTPPTTLWGNPADTTTKEVIYCNACHSSNDFKSSIRNAGQYTAPYGAATVQARVQYPDSAKSNVCLPCHVGQQNETSIDAVTDFTNTNFGAVNSHYLAAGAILNGKSGFKFYTSSTKYFQPYGVNGSHFAHDQIGVNNYKFPLGHTQPTGYDGPCVTCHMTKGSHTLNYKLGYTDPNGVCAKCHVPADGHTMSDAIIEEEKEGYNASLDLFKTILAQNGMYFNAAYPYFYPSSTPAGYGPAYALTNWTIVGPSGGTGKQNMGSAFNYNLLSHEPGAFTHNRSYAKRLIFDSIEYLQKRTVSGTINFTSYSSAAVPVSKARTYLSGSVSNGVGTRP